jgi:hypothetical protein
MNDLLEQAMTASRAGDKAKAHLLLARLIKNDSRNAEAWHQLSILVDDPQQQIIFTRRALAIDAHHAAARKRLAALVGAKPAAPPPKPEPEPTAVAAPPAISSDLTPSRPSEEFLTQAEGETVPDWLAEEEGLIVLETADEFPAEPEQPADLPDWLQEEPEPEWVSPPPEAKPEPKTEPSKAMPAKSAPAKPAPAQPAAAKPASTALVKASQSAAQTPPNWLLPVLVVAALIVFILFILAVTGGLS